MDVLMAFLWALHCGHALYIENTVSFSLEMRKGREWDEGIWGIQDFSSWNSLQNHFPPQDHTTWSPLSLNVMKAALSSGENIFTWQHKSRPGADVRTVDSVARHTHSEHAMDQALKRARNQHRPHWNVTRSGNTHYFITVMVLFWQNRLNYLRGFLQP